ncbi:hscarg dehydrogenase [Aspergillus bombycis]|uniref:Hscarg dehydrogenase n=1 Tax=Aspergillus bombycis TaxID=109264 RepID=A0A1F8AF63_9EURO|nr:hscarg dehydrogenase [Aspergillus bombycis]OGM50039.1 hscarg dehydrogenase [Aspergillus bombycis]
MDIVRLQTVFGATGLHGGSVIDYVLNDPELSQQYRIRAITRNVDSEKAQQLKEKVEVVQGDVLSQFSLKEALNDAHTIFAMTTPTPDPDGLETEYQSAKTIADVTIEKGAEYIIFGTLPPVSEISGGKYTQVTPVEAKAQI